jgi:aromatic-L-amino-acid decarboxylase
VTPPSTRLLGHTEAGHIQSHVNEDPLWIDPESMRRLGYATVDFLVDWVAETERAPLVRGASPAEMHRRLHGPPPEEGDDLSQILEQLDRDVLGQMNRGDHPGYLAFIPACGTWPGALGDFIASACNVYSGSWKDSAGPSQLELQVLGWFSHWVGFPSSAGGILVSGGSAANMTALACAREALIGPMTDDVVIYLSDQAHSSIARAARALGFRSPQVKVLPTDEAFRMRPDALRAVMDRDARDGLRPLFVAAGAGSTNTGAVDPLAHLAEVCAQHGAWFHVDAAYGGFAALTRRGREWLSGIELADSITLDPHKWLYQPFECGCLLVRDGEDLERAFRIVPDYLKDAHESGVVDFCDRGFQLTRMCRALKVWTSLRYFGVAAFRAAIDGCLDIAAHAQRRISRSEELELLHGASLGVVCFRRRPPDITDEDDIEHLNQDLLRRLAQTGDALISSTQLHGHYALRLCVLNHTTRARDVERVLEWLERQEVTVHEPTVSRDLDARARHPTVGRGGALVDRLRDTDLFRPLPESHLVPLAQAATVMTAGPGDTIVERWSYGRDFFVILEGRAEVRVGDARVRELGPGDFFGELAARDWGAGFGYTRLASVIATADMQLVAIPGEALNAALESAPEVEAEIQRAVRERLQRS